MLYAVLQDAHILCIGMVLLILSAGYLQHSIRLFNLDSLSIASVWYFAYAFIIFIPSFWTFYGRTGVYRYNYIYTLMSPMLTVPVGIFLVNVLRKYQPSEAKRYHAAPIEDRPANFMRIMNYSMLFIVAFGLFIGWCVEQKNPIPLLYMFTNPERTEDFLMLREYSFKLLDSPFRYLYHLTRDFLFPLLMLVAFANYYFSRSRTWLFLTFLSSAIGLFFAGANIAKGPVFSLIFLLFLNFYILKGRRLRWWQIILAVVLWLSFPILVLMYTRSHPDWEGFKYAFQKVMERIFVAPSSILYYGFEIIPEHYPFQGGRLTGALAFLFGKERSDLGQYSAWYITGEDHGTTSVSGAFVTELFGDFGPWGVIFGGILVGMAMQWIHTTIVRNPKNLFGIATFVLFVYFFATLTYLQIAGALILSGAPILWLLYRTKALG